MERVIDHKNLSSVLVLLLFSNMLQTDIRGEGRSSARISRAILKNQKEFQLNICHSASASSIPLEDADYYI